MTKHWRLWLWFVFAFSGAGMLSALEYFLPHHRLIALAIALAIAFPAEHYSGKLLHEISKRAGTRVYTTSGE